MTRVGLVFCISAFVASLGGNLACAAEFTIPVTVAQPVPVVVNQPIRLDGSSAPLKVELWAPQDDQQKEKVKSDEQAEREKSDLAAQWLAARSAEKMVTLSWAQFIASIVAVFAAIGSVIIARSTHVAENRPMLVPSVPAFDLGANSKGAPTKVSCVAKNEGRGVALVTGGKMWASMFEEGERAKHPTGKPIKTLWPVSHGQEWGSVDVDLGLEHHERKGIAEGSVKLMIHWMVNYESIAKKKYQLKCAYLWNAEKEKFEPHTGTMFWRV
ncbi:hypothetical protein [Agrobacterium burrii]